jgi:hypothetical protein
MKQNSLVWTVEQTQLSAGTITCSEKFHEEKFFGLDCCTDPPFPGTNELRKIHEAKFFDLDAA